MEKKKYLPLYKAWVKTGKLPHRNGLCEEFGGFNNTWHFDENPLFVLMMPEPYDQRIEPFWAGDGPLDIGIRFTPLRQNIVLLMAALNGEL